MIICDGTDVEVVSAQVGETAARIERVPMRRAGIGIWTAGDLRMRTRKLRIDRAHYASDGLRASSPLRSSKVSN